MLIRGNAASVCSKGRKVMMKKIGYVILAVIVLGVIGAALGSGGKEEEAPAEKKEVYAVGEVVHLEDMDVTVNRVTTSSGEGFIVPEEGKVFVVIEVTLQNTSTDEISYNVLNSGIQNAQGQVETPIRSLYDPGNRLNSGKLVEQGTVTGNIVVEAAESEINSMIFIYEPTFSHEAAKIQLSL